MLSVADQTEKRRISLMVIDKADQETTGRLRLTLRQLEVFVAIARAGSTRAAADRIARSQSAASSMLADLEQSLGTVVFDRHRGAGWC